MMIGKNGNNRTSSTASVVHHDSTSSCASPETNRRSRSILKKYGDSSGNSSSANAHRNGSSAKNDPEMEKLISADNTSMTSGSEYSPYRGPLVRSLRQCQNAQRPQSNPNRADDVGDYTNNNINSEFVLLQNLLGNAHATAPIYICPPPPPSEQSNEESCLLLQQQNNSKGYPTMRYL